MARKYGPYIRVLGTHYPYRHAKTAGVVISVLNLEIANVTVCITALDEDAPYKEKTQKSVSGLTCKLSVTRACITRFRRCAYRITLSTAKIVSNR